MLEAKSKIFIGVLLTILCNNCSGQFYVDHSLELGSEQVFKPSKIAHPIVLTTTPGDLCREFLGTPEATWASYAYRADICTRPISCRNRPSFTIHTRPGSPPEGMLCALHISGNDQEAIKFVCHKGSCVKAAS
ncbi:uncharacterized protein [Fopius arisanus]|uniref:ORF51_2 protein n=1 Tax=Fopius arisanus TaxID=64838 RepID=A0A0C9PJI4_9HYME|nr:PREDICTED: uncharacterized protein LOC105264546 [Fopius arisanus]